MNKTSNTRTLYAGADLDANLFIKFGVDNVAVLCGAGERAQGVTIESVKEGEPVTVVVGGHAIVECAAALSHGQIESDASGRAIALAAGIELGTVLSGGLAPSAVPEYDTIEIDFRPVEAASGP